jgi:hypothetical protein
MDAFVLKLIAWRRYRFTVEPVACWRLPDSQPAVSATARGVPVFSGDSFIAVVSVG